MADKVLIAVDGSEQAEEALNWYLENIHRPPNEVILGNVSEPLVQPAFAFRAGLALPPEQWKLMLKQVEEDANKLKQKYSELMANKGIKCHFSHQTAGNPGHALCELAKKHEVRLVVMGTRGQGTVRRTVLGSVSDYVLHHAHCPVMVCRR